LRKRSVRESSSFSIPPRLLPPMIILGIYEASSLVRAASQGTLCLHGSRAVVDKRGSQRDLRRGRSNLCGRSLHSLQLRSDSCNERQHQCGFAASDSHLESHCPS